ncbi:phage tail protein [Gallibacterium sp. ZY190522]
MKLLDLFKTIIWAKNGDTTDFSQTNYEAGWAHLGDDTPTVQDFNYVQQMNDKKDQWLFKQLKAVMENAGIEPTEDNINALLNAILKIAKGHSTPKAINAETVDFVDETGHTHSISKASLTQLGIVQLTNSLDSDSETLGLTAKAGKALKTLINALTSNLQNYIPNSKKSNSVTSTSSDTVATSYAAKTAYDKGVAALNAANTKLDKTANAVSASKLQTARQISLTGAVSGSGNFDGSGNLSITTNDNLTIGLVTSTSSTGISNTTTSNGNTYLNVVETRGGAANAIGSSTRVTGTGLVDVYSDSSGVLTVRGNRDSGKLNTSGNQSLAGKLTVNDILLASNGNRSLSQVINAFNCLFTGNRDGLKNIVNSWGQSGTTPLGVSYDFSNANAWWINFGPLYGGLIIQGGLFGIAPNTYGTIVKIPIIVKKTLFAINAQAEGNTESAIQTFSTWHIGGADNKTAIHFLINRLLPYQDMMEWIAICIA